VASALLKNRDLPLLGTNPRLVGMIRDCLAEGVARGDVSAELDLDQAVDLLIGAYVWNYRLAASDGADSERLIAQFDRQIGLLFQGFAPARR
jgi:TetR/AcrR family transcriptional regulator, cholesterol catabolism regulator